MISFTRNIRGGGRGRRKVGRNERGKEGRKVGKEEGGKREGRREGRKVGREYVMFAVWLLMMLTATEYDGFDS